MIAAAFNNETVISDITDRSGISERMIDKISELFRAGTRIPSLRKENSFLAAGSHK
jgi:hypothetical protein